MYVCMCIYIYIYGLRDLTTSSSCAVDTELITTTLECACQPALRLEGIVTSCNLFTLCMHALCIKSKKQHVIY